MVVIPVRGNAVYSLHFEDDQVIFAQEKEDMEYMMRYWKEQYELWELKINVCANGYLCILLDNVDLNLNLEEETFKIWQSFNYLELMIQLDGTWMRDIEMKIARGNKLQKHFMDSYGTPLLQKKTKKNLSA